MKLMLNHTYRTIPGFFWFEQGYRNLLNALPKDRTSTFVEIGTFCGKSLSFLGVEVVNRELPVTIHAVDSFVGGLPGMPTGDELKQLHLMHTAPIREALGDRLRLHDVPSMEAVKSFADESVDVVWVDGDHTYEGCLADILAWYPKIKPGGWMGGDDWFMHGVQRAVGEQFAPNYILGHGFAQAPEQTGYWPWWLVNKAGA